MARKKHSTDPLKNISNEELRHASKPWLWEHTKRTRTLWVAVIMLTCTTLTTYTWITNPKRYAAYVFIGSAALVAPSILRWLIEKRARSSRAYKEHWAHLLTKEAERLRSILIGMSPSKERDTYEQRVSLAEQKRSRIIRLYDRNYPEVTKRYIATTEDNQILEHPVVTGQLFKTEAEAVAAN